VKKWICKIVAKALAQQESYVSQVRQGVRMALFWCRVWTLAPFLSITEVTALVTM
jgi:hypothetical protein